MGNYKHLLILAEHYFKEKNFIYSEALLKQVIQLSPTNSKANELLGYIYANQGNLDFSFKLLELACQNDACSPEALYYLGSFQLKRKLFNAAIDTLKKAINKKGIFFEALHDLGACYGHIGKIQEALSCYGECLKLNKDSFELYFNIGRCLDELKDYEKALFHYDKAIKLKPDYEMAWLNKGITLNDLGRYDESIVHYDHVLKLNPQCVEAWSYKGAVLDTLGRYDEALFQYDQAINLNSSHAEVWSYKGATLNDLRRYDEALFHYAEAIRLKPEYAEAWSNKGATLNNLKRYDEALFHYDKAIQIKPDYDQARFNRAILKLNQKNFDEGWEDYEVRIKNKNIINFEFPLNIETVPVWDGFTPCKHLLVIHEQGVGDQIFYASSLLQIQSMVEKITVLIDGRLIPILSRSFPLIKFLDKKNIIDRVPFNAQVAIGSLPKILKDNFFKVGILRQPYLVDNFVLTNKVKNSEIFKKKFTCGISWKSSNKKLEIQKSIDLLGLSEILKVPNCQFINLQYGDTDQEVRDFEGVTEVKLNKVNDIDVFSDIDGLLSIIQSCDIVITTSNITAHLAGAIGKKTLLLLPYSQGRIWYWHEGADSTWYPSTKQYFQDCDLRWGKAIKEIATELRSEIDRKN